MVCFRCGTAFVNAKYCPECGAPVSDGPLGQQAAAMEAPPAPVLQVQAEPVQELQVMQSTANRLQPMQQPAQGPQSPHGAPPNTAFVNQQSTTNVNYVDNTVNYVDNTVNVTNVNMAGGYAPAYPAYAARGISPKNRTVALITCLLLGALGIHRFYVGKVGTGLLYFFTGGLFSFGWLVDIISILCGTFEDSNGQRLTEW